MFPVITLGKSIRRAMHLRGGGSTLPGLVVERIDPNFLKRTLRQLPHGVVVISGTNGKTTTTKMVVELLQSQGLKVFSNPTGSNFTRGIVSSLLGAVDNNGKLRADIAVLELDEAHAVHFVNDVKPNFSLLLNVMRDQLDRFGEIDTTARMLEIVAKNTTEAVVLNREDPRIAAIAKKLDKQTVHYFGLSSDAKSHFPNDDELHQNKTPKQKKTQNKDAVVLESFKNSSAVFSYLGKSKKVTLKLDGIYNVFNAAAALALVQAVVQNKVNEDSLFSTLKKVTPAFGRGEIIEVDGKPLELVLVKNPAGFRLGLKSFSPKGYATMIAINDNYADGRDMSWLWDVDFSSLKKDSVTNVSGTRAYDMALRLQYDDVKVESVCTDLKAALRQFKQENKDKPKRIFCTYTAMLAIRKELGKTLKMES